MQNKSLDNLRLQAGINSVIANLFVIGFFVLYATGIFPGVVLLAFSIIVFSWACLALASAIEYRSAIREEEHKKPKS